ncbi:Acetyl-CoA synthetase-like protein [Glarea lozoyensis ATCC 20868]|uniref:Acetyl-CoA synthetase-like protein n=1 Tax=Glarea lozoyensis (strain ATCC 20868 / MF5171) TaxID=1116229 RepID=S3E552_GLAL2|nr:Acetyl-CoA synthetase-like protein [Glarea lozoyensis ATCC 20868]EPE33543.1 Acetyl-CoA synthetase-like protein [Glarea lozoyensis ATCC 20868]
MGFYPTRYEEIPNVDLLTWIFGGPEYDQDKDIYIDALDSTRRTTNRQARSTVRKLIYGFKLLGIKPGDSVLVHSFSDIMYPILYLGIIGAGASFVGSNPGNTPIELAHIFSQASIQCIITSPEQHSTIMLSINNISVPISHNNILIFNTPHHPSIPDGFQSWETLLKHGETPWEYFKDEKLSKEAITSLFSTSGTTGTPKIAALSHHATIARCIASYDPHPKPYPVSRLLCLPMFHGVAATASHIDPLRYGIPTYILPRFSLFPFLDAIEKYNVTETSMVPVIMSMILRGEAGTEEYTKRKLNSLRLVRCAGAPLDLGVQTSFQGQLDVNAKIQRAWGLTEFGTVTSFLQGEKDETGSCGRLLVNVEARIIDATGLEIFEEDVSGEVLVRGPSMATRYLGNEQATTDAFADGWLKTGDIAYCKAGKWYLVGRSKDMIKVRGWQVAPAELESCLMEHPYVTDVAVIGIKSTSQETELPRAYVVLRQTSDSKSEMEIPTEEELKTFLGSRLAKYKALGGGVRFVESLPKTATGKTMKLVLQEAALKELRNR